jgi:hypothetical protein
MDENPSAQSGCTGVLDENLRLRLDGAVLGVLPYSGSTRTRIVLSFHAALIETWLRSRQSLGSLFSCAQQLSYTSDPVIVGLSLAR